MAAFRPALETWGAGSTAAWAQTAFGAQAGWAQAAYGEYYPRSAVVYAAIKVRQGRDGAAAFACAAAHSCNAAAHGWRETPGPRGELVGADHPLQRLLDSPNPFWSRSDLWRATETYLSLWGAAFWALEAG